MTDMARTAVCEKNILYLWCQIVDAFPDEKSFCVEIYGNFLIASASAHALACEFFLNGHIREAAYMIIYEAALLEVLQRGPDMMKMLLEVQSPTVQFHHFYFHSAFYATHSRERMEIYLEQYMEEDMDCTLRDDLAFLTCLNQKIRELGCQDDDYLAWIETITEGESSYRGEMVKIIITNLDNESKQERLVYKNTTLEWLLRTYVFRCIASPNLQVLKSLRL